MNGFLKVLASITLGLLVIGCQKAPTTSATTPQADVADAKSGFVILNALGFADITDGVVKYTDAIPLGEKVSLTGEATKAGSAGAERDFVQVKRDSGKIGWARTDFVIPSSVLGVVISDGAVVYSEPKNTGATATSIPKMTILAIHSDTTGQPFLKVTVYVPAPVYFGKAVYLKNDAVSSKRDDVQSAILLQLASASTKPTQKQAFLDSAIKDYPGSTFIVQIEDALTALTAPPPAKATDKFFAAMVSTADKVNVRDTPDEQSGKVVGTLSKDQKVDVEEKTSEDYTVGDKTAPWYKIAEPAGWVFGAFLTAEQ